MNQTSYQHWDFRITPHDGSKIPLHELHERDAEGQLTVAEYGILGYPKLQEEVERRIAHALQTPTHNKTGRLSRNEYRKIKEENGKALQQIERKYGYGIRRIVENRLIRKSWKVRIMEETNWDTGFKVEVIVIIDSSGREKNRVNVNQ